MKETIVRMVFEKSDYKNACDSLININSQLQEAEADRNIQECQL